MDVKSREKYGNIAFFILPCILVLIIFSVIPLVYSLNLTVHNWTIATRDNPPFVGLDNFKQVILDWRFWATIKTTFALMVFSVGLQFLLGLGIALLLNKRFLTGKSVYRTIILVPMMLSPMVIGYLFRIMYHPTAGPVNYLLGLVGFPYLEWLANTRLAFLAVILTDTWEWTPFLAVIILAGLQGIPEQLLEAARIDGASELKIFLHITFPLLMPVTIIAVLLRIIDVIRMFDVPFILTHGGPGTATEVTSLYIYSQGFKNFNLSYAAAMSWLLLIFSIIIAQVFLRILRKRGNF